MFSLHSCIVDISGLKYMEAMRLSSSDGYSDYCLMCAFM